MIAANTPDLSFQPPIVSRLTSLHGLALRSDTAVTVYPSSSRCGNTRWKSFLLTLCHEVYEALV